MLQNAYFLAKIGADTAENEQHFAEILPKIGNYPTGPGATSSSCPRPQAARAMSLGVASCTVRRTCSARAAAAAGTVFALQQDEELHEDDVHRHFGGLVLGWLAGW